MTGNLANIVLTTTTALGLCVAVAQAETLTIATFSDPTPMNAARAQKEFEKAAANMPQPGYPKR